MHKPDSSREGSGLAIETIGRLMHRRHGRVCIGRNYRGRHNRYWHTLRRSGDNRRITVGDTILALAPIGDAELYTETIGQGEDLLLVAGLGGSATFWRGQADALARSYRVTLYDHRGVGRSSPAPLVSTSEELANDLLKLMDVLQIDRAHVVGHSTGGAIGQHLALRAPDRLRSLVLSASWAGPTSLFIELFKLRRDVLINNGMKSYLLLGTVLATPAWYLQERFTGIDDFLQDRLRDLPALDVELGRLNAVMTHDLRHRVADIRVPTAVICARDDQITPEPMSTELAELIPGATLRVLPEGGHFCPATVTDRYNQTLIDALVVLGGSMAHSGVESDR
jgi:aminoacrylate hydrolase